MNAQLELHEQLTAFRRSFDEYRMNASVLLQEYDDRIADNNRQLALSGETLRRAKLLLG
jgi:hypothetical protein